MITELFEGLEDVEGDLDNKDAYLESDPEDVNDTLWVTSSYMAYSHQTGPRHG